MTYTAPEPSFSHVLPPSQYSFLPHVYVFTSYTSKSRKVDLDGKEGAVEKGLKATLWRGGHWVNCADLTDMGEFM